MPPKLSKEQLRAMRAQRAALLAAQQPPAAASAPPEPAPAAPTTSAEEDARSMPPPPPRAPSAARSQPPPFQQQQQQQQRQQQQASYHADSQGTRLHDTAALQALADAHAEPSINQGAGGAAPASAAGGAGGSAEEVRSTASGLPQDFFPNQANNASVVGSAGAPASAAPAAAAAAAAPVLAPPAQQAVSLEGSTGPGAAAGSPPGADVTSAASLQGAGLSALSGAVPAGFFDGPGAADSIVGGSAAAGAAAADGDAGVVVSSRPPPQAEAAAAAAGDGGASLPKGFFEDKKADAKARGEVPKSQKDMTKEYADFLKQVEMESTAAAAELAHDEEAEAAGRLDREDFEQFVRMQKLEGLKQARVGGKRAAEEEQEVEAAAAAIADPEVQRPVIQLQKKRRVLDTIAELEAGPAAGDSSSEDDDDLLDWRAKKSAF